MTRRFSQILFNLYSLRSDLNFALDYALRIGSHFGFIIPDGLHALLVIFFDGLRWVTLQLPSIEHDLLF